MGINSVIGRMSIQPRRAVVGGLMAWYGIVFLVPFLIVAKISLAHIADATPPFTPLVAFEQSGPTLLATTANFSSLVSDPIFVSAYLGSLRMAAVTTVLCILIGYPIAYAIAISPRRTRPTLLILLTIPFWTSILIRIYAWFGLLKDNGTVNGALMSLGLIDHPLIIMNTMWSVYIVMVYCYLPFFVLPLYAVIEDLDVTLVEAAADLGAPPWVGFWYITLPLSFPGVLAGGLLVFIPAVGEYLIPRLVGGASSLNIAAVLWDTFFVARDWPLAAAGTVVLLLFLLVPIALTERLRRRAAAVAVS